MVQTKVFEVKSSDYGQPSLLWYGSLINKPQCLFVNDFLICLFEFLCSVEQML